MEPGAKGNAGNVTITSKFVEVKNDALISAGTFGENKQVIPTANIEAVGTEPDGNITINTNQLNITGKLRIFADTAGSDVGSFTLKPYQTDPNLNITFTENGSIDTRNTSTGNGGNILISAPESINIEGEGRIRVDTEGSGNAGIIKIQTKNLTIAEKTTISTSTSGSGDGGSININPSQTFRLEGRILTETIGTGNGGQITINTGEMFAPNSSILAQSTDVGNAGPIDITAQGNITTGIITSENNETETANGGKIIITSEQGTINATRPIQSFSDRANAGNVILQAKTDITTNTISSHGQQQGGQITITSETGNIDTSNGNFLANYSGGGNADNITLTAPQGNIITNNIYSFADADGGQITIKAGNNIDITENSKIISASETPTDPSLPGGGTGKGGDIILEAGNNINTTTARIYSGAKDGNTGKIDIIADNAIETGIIDLASGFVREKVTVNNNFTFIPKPEGEATQGVAGDITIRSNESTIDTTAGTINSRSPDGTGDIILEARENITTGKLEASALNESKPSTGGNIEITSQNGQVNATQAIETFSTQGTAGNVTIQAEGSIQIEKILSQGTQRGGDIIIDSDSENGIDIQGGLNTFSTEGIAGDVSLTSPGSISLNGIRSEGMQQGGEITVESEIGNIDSRNGNIDSFSTQGRGGNIILNAPGSVTLGDVSSYGITESGDLRIQSRRAQVNTGNVITQATAGSSGNIIVNGEEVGTGDLRSISTTSVGELNFEAIDGSITTYDIETTSDDTTGNLRLREPEDINTSVIDQTVDNNNLNQTAGEDFNIPDIDQTSGNGVNQNTDSTPVISNAKNQTESSINNTTDTQQILNTIDIINTNSLTVTTDLDQVIKMLEQKRSNEYSNYLEIDFNKQFINTKNIRETLSNMAKKTRKEFAVVYINAYPDELQIILYTKSGQPIIKTISKAKRKKLMNVVLKLRVQITDPARRNTNRYLPPAQQLYDWLIAPISEELEIANIDTLLFSMDEGLRTLPVAVLHDGEQFLIEKYSMSLIPSMGLVDTNYRSLQDTQVLAMGASKFIEQNPLPAVPVELETISQKLWQGRALINEKFTRNNLLSERKNYPYPIIHLATHAEFKPGSASNSYIQLWDKEQIKLNQVRELGWNQPAVELLVLSACRTAVGDKNAELGYAGLAIAAGVKSALASIWYVSDEGTLGLMTEFYTYLNNTKIKAEALRKAQLAMLRGEVVILEGELRGSGVRGTVQLPSEFKKLSNQNLSHPYYWAGFTMVGSPW